MSGFPISGRPSTPPPDSQSLGLDPSLSGVAGKNPVKSSYEPHLFDLIFAAGTDGTAPANIPHTYLTSSSIDSSVLLGSGASFSASVRVIPEGPPLNRAIVKNDKWTIESVGQSRKRPSHVVYKTARLAFDAQGEAQDGFKNTFQSVLTELHALLYPPLRSHPNIIDYFGLAWGTNHFNTGHRLPAIVVEYADLGTLADVLKAQTLSSTNKVPLAQDVVAGLQALHSAGLIHGDIKAENVLLFSKPDRMVAKLADFGFSVVSETANAEVWIGGTPPYQAPEADRPIALAKLPLTDVYSLGFLLWSLALSGAAPFDFLLPRGSSMSECEKLKKSDTWPTSYRLLSWGKAILEKWTQEATLLTLSAGFAPTGGQPSSMTSETKEKSLQIVADIMFLSTLDQVFPHCLSQNPEQRSLEKVHQVLLTASSFQKQTAAMASNQKLENENSGTEPPPPSVDSDQKTLPHLLSWDMRGYKHRFLSWQKVRVLPPGLQSLVARTLSDNDYIHNFIQSSLLMNGYGCKSDHHKALEYLRRAGESGHAIGTAYMYRLHVSCGVDDIPGWDTRKKLSDAAKIGSRAAMNDLQDLDPQMALTAKKWLAFTAGGVGSDWYDRVNMLHGLTQADLMNDAKFLAQAQAAEDVNSFRVNQRGDTLLHFAAACGREVSIVTLIKQFSANVEVTNNAGDTPLICACRSGHGRIVAYFLKLCNANTKVVTHNGETPAHWLIQFDDSGAELLAKDLLSQGANVNSQTNIRISHSTFPGTVDCDFQVPGTPLSWAVHDNKLNAVRALLSNGADPQVAMLEGRSALEWAAHYHHHECLGIMIAHIERLHEQDASNDNRNDKRFALRYGPLVSAAIKAADKFSMILRNGKEYLHRLHSTLDLLREKITMITFSKQIDWVNQSFLYYAVSNGYDEVVEYMLKNNWLDQKIDEKNGDFQRTPLLEAVRWNRRSMVDLLIEHGADVYACATNPYQPSETGWTALHVLAEEGHNDDEALELASYLISLGVRVDSRSTREASGAWTQGAVVGSAKVATSNLSTGDANDLAQDAAPAPTMIGANGLAQAVSDSPSIDVAGRSTTKDTIQSTTYVASKSASDKTAVDVIKGGSGPSIEAADGFAMVAEDGPTTKADTQSPSIPAKETGTRSFSTEDVISSSLHSFKLSSPSELKSQSPQSSFTTTEVPLSVALRYNSFRFATRLIFLGASPNALSLSASLFSTPHPTTILGHIITTNARYSRDRLSFLLSHPGIDFIVEPTRGLTALHRAAMAEDGVRFIDTDRAVERHEFDDGTNEEITRILLGRWGNSKEMGALTRDGQTALMLATEHGNVGVVRALLDAGADRTMQDDVGRTAKDIARALRSEVAERIRRLLEEA